MKSPALSRAAEAVFLALSLVIVTLIAALSYLSGRDATMASAEAAQARLVVDHANALLSSLKDAETGQRGFVLTGEDRYLEPYRRALATIPGILDHLAADTAHEPEQGPLIAQLRGGVSSKLQELQETIEVRRTQGVTAAVAIVATDRGKKIMDDLRGMCAQIIAGEDRPMAASAERAELSARRLRLVSTGGATALFGFLLVAALTIVKGTAARQQLIHETEAARDLWETTIASIGDAIITTDEGPNITFLNSVAEDLTGYTRDESRGLPLNQVFHIVNETTRQKVDDPIQKALSTGTVVGLANHTVLIRKDGSEIPIDDSAAPIRDRQGRVIGGVLVFRDITERRRSELELKATENRLRMTLESISDAFIGLDTDWKFTYLNTGAKRLLARDDLAGESFWSECGQVFSPEFETQVRKAAAEQSAVHFEIAAAQREAWFQVHAYPAQDGGLSIYFQDITARKNAEQERDLLLQRLQRSNEDLERFADAASHDLRSPLRTVASMAQLLARRYSDQLDSQGRELIDFLSKGTARMDALISGLLTFSKATEHDQSVQNVPLDDCLHAALGNLRAAIADSAAAITAGPMPVVRAQPNPLIQVFQNLIANSISYRRDEALRIEIGATRIGPNWVIHVRDNGMGFDPKFATVIFDPFKRLHGDGISGNGIGLATCKRIVERFHGTIWAESEPGSGSTFYFSLPG